MNNTILNVAHESCTGCGACYNRCPQKAIAMKENSEGFLFPAIVGDCIDCGVCLRVCPAEHPVKLHENAECFAVWAPEAVRLKSSSGGMFTLLADAVFYDGGMVCGAVYEKGYMAVRHAWASNHEELSALRGSKYVQSAVGTTYREAEQYLKEGRKVLYSGCPCQIAGLYSFLGKDYENLITADIICHGVPSPLVFKRYLEEKSNGKDIEKLDFREKTHFGWGTATSLFLSDGSVYRGDCFKDPYLRGFLGGVTVRKNCGICNYTKMDRIGDFTIGDFWGVSSINKKFDDGKGTSLVMINTDKAKRIFEKLRTNAVLAEKVDWTAVAEIAKTRNGQLLHPTRTHGSRRRFFDFLPMESFSKAFDHALRRHDVGYVGWWDSTNYGSALTCFAMNRVLTKMGKSVLMLEHSGIQPSEKLKESYGFQFATRFFDCSKITKEKDFRRFNDACETFIVGSDQLWASWNHKNNSSNFFFLDFVNSEHKKIAYATSFASDTVNYPEWKRLEVGYLMSRFDGISVREKSGVDICRNNFSAEATWVMDPVFLCDHDSWSEVVGISKCKEQKKYLFAYILDATADKLAIVRTIAEKRGLEYRIAIDGQKKMDSVQKELAEDPNILVSLRIEDWLYYIKNSSYVVTDSFHAFCFSMIFEKNMVAFTNALRGKSRFDSIAELTGLESRVVESSAEVLANKIWEQDIDFAEVSSRLSKKIAESRKWLEGVLNAPVKAPNVRELHYWKTIESDHRINLLEERIGKLEKILESQKALPQINDTPKDITSSAFWERILRVRNEGPYKVIRIFNHKILTIKKKR